MSESSDTTSGSSDTMAEEPIKEEEKQIEEDEEWESLQSFRKLTKARVDQLNAEKSKRVVHELAKTRLSNSLIQAVALLRQRNRQGVVSSLNDLLACDKAVPSQPLSWEVPEELADLFVIYSKSDPAPEKLSRLQYLLDISDSTAEALQGTGDRGLPIGAEEEEFGCDASILLDDTSDFTGEKTAGPNNNSVRGFDVIDTVKSQVETLCPGVVSCADILALAARDSVVALGGPSWTVPLGRRDSTTASFSAANSDLPSPAMDISDLITAFSNKGFTAKEMVALSGSHSTGQARCLMFKDRIYNEANINSSFATSLKSNCPSSGGDENLSPLDATSPVIFDNAYFKNLVNKKGLLHSDQQLFNGGSTDSQVTTYSTNPAVFYADFASAMVKMGNLSPLTGSNGQIRTSCRKIN
ncbi:hypothetical protein F0562_021574 [Nyssa sinensis]|uniref:Peroxidase n=1 Tax=Nyssa sinensis TaxID=561372 RepID=A0A5J5BNE8_9ASTE|nr:hypothetical protein F0562_021574 [Nyssa sinensis]